MQLKTENMVIAIHHRPGSFSDQWITYCDQENIAYKIVNCFDNDIIDQLKDCNALIWHHDHRNLKDVLLAKKILFAIDHAGILVFPDFRTGWHFDDKVAQKYLLEAIDAPMVPSNVFYDREEALAWARSTQYPKVFKLKGGSSSSNVRLVKDENQAKKLIHKAFKRGFSQFDRRGNLKERYRRYREGQSSILGIGKGLARIFISTKFSKFQPRERGYVYFQDFIPNNKYDTRVVVVGNRAVAERRMVRKGDFRASGSGIFNFNDINLRAIKIAFEISRKARFQSMAFDFVEDQSGNPLVVEVSYGFGIKGISQACGYWDSDLQWHEEKFTPNWILNDLIKFFITLEQ